MENKYIHHHHQRSPSIGSPSHFPPRFNHSLLFQSGNNNEEIMEGCCCCALYVLSFLFLGLYSFFSSFVILWSGDSDRSEKDLQQVATSNEERGYNNGFYKG